MEDNFDFLEKDKKVFIKFNCFTDEEGRPGGEEGDEEEAECSSSATSGSGRNLLDLCRQPTVWTYWGFALGSENCQTRAFAGLDEDNGRSLPTASAEQSVLKKNGQNVSFSPSPIPSPIFSPTSQSHH